MTLQEIKKTLDPKWVGVDQCLIEDSTLITMESPFGYVVIRHKKHKKLNIFDLYVGDEWIDSTYCIDSIKEKYYEYVYLQIIEHKKYLGL